MKYIGYLLYDEESPEDIEWCFIVTVKDEKDLWHRLKDGTWQIPNESVVDFEDFIGEYDSDVFYAEDKDLHNNFNDACKDILKELFSVN